MSGGSQGRYVEGEKATHETDWSGGRLVKGR